jgi:hypothetical protein
VAGIRNLRTVSGADDRWTTGNSCRHTSR